MITTCSAPAAAASSISRARHAGRSTRRWVSPRQYESGANWTRRGSLTPGRLMAAARTSAVNAWVPLDRSCASARRDDTPPGGGNSALRNGSRTSPNTRSRWASMSCTTNSNSRNPGCPRFSASNSAYRRLRSVASGVLMAAPPLSRRHTLSVACRIASVPSIGEPSRAHALLPDVRRCNGARHHVNHAPTANVSTAAPASRAASRGSHVGSAAGKNAIVKVSRNDWTNRAPASSPAMPRTNAIG